MADVVDLQAILGGRTVPAAISDHADAETVRLLRDLLARAEAGEVSGVAVATLGPERPEGGVGEAGTAWSGAVRRNVHAALGAVTSLQLRLHGELFEVKR
ncbi:hypothetical protein [Azospirillum argentinense]|uniref:hypothetical protein n=1 Tax=Azospirillum argentinense TaxID=2970906 RepID=UPI0032DE58A0